LNRQDENGGAMKSLLLKTIASPDTLEALLHMIDADIRSGEVGWCGLIILKHMIDLKSSWTMKLKDGSDFLMRLLSSSAKYIHDDVTGAGM
jgi:hypothetical protein